ncbi:hypothetical protein [Bartonella sp. B41]
MNTKSNTINQVVYDTSSACGLEKKEEINAPSEVTMLKIAAKLRSVYAQMKMVRPYHQVTYPSSVDDNFKSYLDDISRAILVEYYTRRQKEKEFFVHLEQIKVLIQGLHDEKKRSKENTTARRTFHSKSLDSVIHHLARTTYEENDGCFSLQDVHFSEKNSANTIQMNTGKVGAGNESQQSLESYLLKNSSMESSEKDAEKFIKYSEMKEGYSHIQDFCDCVGDDQLVDSFKMELCGVLFSLGHFFKKTFKCLLIIAFMATIALCFYGFLEGWRFF